MRQITGAAIATAAACVLGAVALANIPAAGHTAPPVTKKSHHAAPLPSLTGPTAAAYLSVDIKTGAVIVRRTTTGARLATVRPPHGGSFYAVGGGEDDRTFVLASEGKSRSAVTQLYLLVLNAHNLPEHAPTKLFAPLPNRLGSCPADLAGLAVGPAKGGVVAASLLTYCPTGRAGPGEILTFSISSGHLATFHPGNGYPQWLSWTEAGSLVYEWSGNTDAVFTIPDAIKPGGKARLLIGSSDSVGGFNGAGFPLVSLDGKTVFATVSRGGNDLAIASFSTNGRTKKLLSPPRNTPPQFCGPLWADASGRRLLAACGDKAEFEIQDGHVNFKHRPWVLPTYPTPGAPSIAW